MKPVQTIIFSRNRALQLHLCLSTLLNHCTDILQQSDITVLYRNDIEHEKSYATLMSEFPQISFKKEENFKKDLLNMLSNESNISWGENKGFVTFIVDDQVFTEDFSMHCVMDSLNLCQNCLGFSLRLGRNCHRCFPYNCEQNIPDFWSGPNEGTLQFNWQKSEYDFNYPLELSASTYRIIDVMEVLEFCQYNSPNSLESCMSACLVENKPDLLCYETSRSFSIPLNRVQSSHPNRNANRDPDTFRLLYEKGIRFDSKQFDGFISKGAHDLVENIKVVDINESM